jgi:hypothetical protein
MVGLLYLNATHWIELLKERGKVNNEKYKQFKLTAKKLSLKLNNFIASLYKLKSNEYPQISTNIHKYP